MNIQKNQYKTEPEYLKMLWLYNQALWKRNLNYHTQKPYVLSTKGGENMDEEKNYSHIVTLKNGEKLYCSEIEKTGTDVVLFGSYKDGKKWRYETSKDQIAGIKSDVPPVM